MSKRKKVWLVTGLFFMVTGLIGFAVVMTIYKWDFKKLDTQKYETVSYEFDEDFSSIVVDCASADVIIVPTDNKAKVISNDWVGISHFACVQEGKLIINSTDNGEWYKHIGISVNQPQMTVFLPKNEYDSISITGNAGDIEICDDFTFLNVEIYLDTGDVNLVSVDANTIKADINTGDIKIENISADTLDISDSTGTMTVSNAECSNLRSEGDTGDIILNNVRVTKKTAIRRDTGKVEFQNSDFAEISVKTDTGDVVGTLLSGKVFNIETSTGSVNVPENASGGKCEIITEAGNIDIRLTN